MKLSRSDWTVLGALVALGAFIWARDLRWWSASDDTLPILAALPLLYWLGRPWIGASRRAARLSPRPALLAAGLFPLGIVTDSGLILAAGWTALLWSWLAVRFQQSPGTFRRKLLVLPMLSFPWLVTDFETIAWWFRLSGAVVTEQLLSALQVPVLREGTMLWCNHLAISVEPACSGVNGLQSMLVAGSALLYLKLRASRLFWWNLPLLAGAAWLAHLFRITTAALCGVFLSPESAARWVGPIHAFTGWLGLVAGFAVCYAWFSWQARWLARSPALRRPSEWSGVSWMHAALLVYAAFCARGLIESWRWAPYDRLAWVAFLIWLGPLFRPARGPGNFLTERPTAVLGLVCGLLLAAAAADINAIYHVALAVALVGWYRRDGAWLPWALGALAWLPAAGWFASRLGVEPATFSICRITAAVIATGFGVGWPARRRFSPATRTDQVAVPAWMRRKPRHAD